MSFEITILTNLSNPSRKFWSQTVNSVFTQTDSGWKWVIIRSERLTEKNARRARSLAELDSRVTFVEENFSPDFAVMLKTALTVVEGEFIVFVNEDAYLAPECVSDIRIAVIENPDVDVLYTDDDRVGCLGRKIEGTRKPAWSPEALRGFQYLGNFVLFRTELVRPLDVARTPSQSAFQYDLILRSTEKARKVVRVPKVLFHQRNRAKISDRKHADSTDVIESVGAVRKHLERIGIHAAVEPAADPKYLRIRRNALRVKPISVIIPTRGTAGQVHGAERVFVESLIKSLIRNSGGAEVEYIVVFDEQTPQKVLARLRDIAGERIKLMSYAQPFNFSSKCNLGAVAARYDNLVFLNDDMECLTQDVLANLVAPLTEHDVGITSAKLLFEDGSIQHGGHLHELGDNRINYYRAPASERGMNGALLVNREVSGVTGACMAIRKSVFMRLGGFSELFPNSYNDVDLCNKARAMGYRILWLAGVELTHFESKSRQPVVNAVDYENIHKRWGSSPDEFFT